MWEVISGKVGNYICSEIANLLQDSVEFAVDLNQSFKFQLSEIWDE